MSLAITEIRIHLADPAHNDRLRAYASVVVCGCIVIHDVKVIALDDGRFIIAMPNRKRAERCPQCPVRNPVVARFCSSCGCRLDPAQWPLRDECGRSMLHFDTVHPLDNDTRATIEAAVLEAYAEEVERQRTGRLAEPVQPLERLQGRPQELVRSRPLRAVP